MPQPKPQTHPQGKRRRKKNKGKRQQGQQGDKNKKRQREALEETDISRHNSKRQKPNSPTKETGPPPPDVLRARALWRACFGDSDAFTEAGGLRIDMATTNAHFAFLATLTQQATAALSFPLHAMPPTRLESVRAAFSQQPHPTNLTHPQRAAALIYDSKSPFTAAPEPVGAVIVRLSVDTHTRGLSGKRAFSVPLLFLRPDRECAPRFEAAALYLLVTMALALDCDILVLEQRIPLADEATQRRWREAYGATVGGPEPNGKRPEAGLSVRMEQGAMVAFHKRFSEAQMAANGGGGGEERVGP